MILCQFSSRKIRACTRIHLGPAASRVQSQFRSYSNLTVHNLDAFLFSFSILSCTQYAVGSNGTVEVNYSSGGKAVILVPDDILAGSMLCSPTSQGNDGLNSTSDGRHLNVPVATIVFAILTLLFFICS